MKTKLLLTLFVLLQMNLFAQFPINGLVAQYGFDNGSVLVDGAAGQNFTQTGTALTQINDRFGNLNAINLTGDYLTRSDINSDNLSYSFWIKTSVNSQVSQTIIDDSQRPSSVYGYNIELQNGMIYIIGHVQYQSASAPQLPPTAFISFSPKNISDNEWHHIVISLKLIPRSSSMNEVETKVYIDGNLEDIDTRFPPNTGTTTSMVVDFNTNGNVTIGNNRNGSLPNADRYQNSIDDLLIYNRELTQAEITSISAFNNFCFVPSTNIFSLNAAQTSVTLTFSRSGTFDIAYVRRGEPFANATIHTDFGGSTTTGTITGLMPNTAYDLFVREQCTNTTAWSSPRLLTTLRPIGRIYVNTAATGNNNGVTWADAYTSLADALAIARNDEEIWVAGGTYIPSTSARNSSFLISDTNLKIYGGFAGTESSISDRVFGTNETILSGDLQGNDAGVLNYSNTTKADNSYTVVNISSSAENALLDNLTIANGYNFVGAVVRNGNGAGLNIGSEVEKFTINQCKFKNNLCASGGAGLYKNISQTGTSNEYLISACEFDANYGRFGSALLIDNANATGAFATTDIAIANSLFQNNTSADEGSNLGIGGSALWIRHFRPAPDRFDTKIINNTFINNKDLGTDTRVNNFNRVPVAVSKPNGIHNVTLSNNIYWDNTTIGGLASKSVSSLFDVAPVWTFSNSIAEDNLFGIAAGDKTNISTSDPLFTSASTNDYTLTNSSPAIDNGDINEVIGTKDLANNLRVFTTAVDIGAYEFGSPVTRGAIFVDATASGAANGFSWINAFTDLNDALAVAGTNDEIWMAAGTYTPDATDKLKLFEINATGVKLYGGFAGTEVQLSDRVFGSNETILSGDLLGNDVNSTSKSVSTNLTNTTRRNDNSHAVILIAANNVLLENLTITGAHQESSGTATGGAIIKNKSIETLSVKNCTIKDNVSRNACAGLFAEFELPVSASGNLTIENCEFTNNFSRWGTALYSFVRTNTNATVTVVNSLFNGNVAEDLNTSLRGFGGSAAWFRNLGNSATLGIVFTNNTVINNIDLGTSNGALNSATRASLGLGEQSTFNGTINAEVNNCIFYNNNTGGGGNTAIGPIHTDFPSSVTVNNSIDEDDFSNITVANKVNTSNSDPLFTSTTDFTLQSSSLAIDTGDNTKVIGGADLLNNNRIANTTVDMGCYEFGSSPFLSVEDLQNDQPIVNIYPNPTVNRVIIDSSVNFDNVSLLDITGKVISKTKKNTVNLFGLSSGVYLLQIQNENSIITKRIIKR